MEFLLLSMQNPSPNWHRYVCLQISLLQFYMQMVFKCCDDQIVLLFFLQRFFDAEDAAQKERETDGSRDVAFPCCIMKFICLWNPSSSSSSFFPSWNLLQFQGKHREQYYWGTYRSTLYLGIRARYVWTCLCKIFLWCNSKNNNRQRICCRVLLFSCSKWAREGFVFWPIAKRNSWERMSEREDLNCRRNFFLWIAGSQSRYWRVSCG